MRKFSFAFCKLFREISWKLKKRENTKSKNFANFFLSICPSMYVHPNIASHEPPNYKKESFKWTIFFYEIFVFFLHYFRVFFLKIFKLFREQIFFSRKCKILRNDFSFLLETLMMIQLIKKFRFLRNDWKNEW